MHGVSKLIIIGYTDEMKRVADLYGTAISCVYYDFSKRNTGKIINGQAIKLYNAEIIKDTEEAICIITANDMISSVCKMEADGIFNYIVYDCFNKHDYSKNVNSLIEYYNSSVRLIDAHSLLRLVIKKEQMQLLFMCEHADICRLTPATGYKRKRQRDFVEFAAKILDELNEIGIYPFIIGGNLIGALRNGSFIPWDDDIDVGIMRDDLDALKEYFADKIFIYDGRYPQVHYWIDDITRKNKNKEIMIVYHDQVQISVGYSLIDRVFVDLFPFDYYKDTYNIHDHMKYVSEVEKKARNSELSFKERLEYVENERLNLIKAGIICDNSERIFYGLDSIESYNKEINDKFIEKKIIFPLKKIEFEGYMFYAPNKPEEYIVFEYPNWRECPNDVGITPHDWSYEYRLENYKNLEIAVCNEEEVERTAGIYNKLRAKGINVLYRICNKDKDLEDCLILNELEYKHIANYNADLLLARGDLTDVSLYNSDCVVYELSKNINDEELIALAQNTIIEDK
ncbi:MAG: LicD family protein [Pseudobutyrivibrio sp.]|nr:LicD family protein [Pseudobutyrivibrio sp.]